MTITYANTLREGALEEACAKIYAKRFSNGTVRKEEIEAVCKNDVAQNVIHNVIHDVMQKSVS